MWMVVLYVCRYCMSDAWVCHPICIPDYYKNRTTYQGTLGDNQYWLWWKSVGLFIIICTPDYNKNNTKYQVSVSCNLSGTPWVFIRNCFYFDDYFLVQVPFHNIMKIIGRSIIAEPYDSKYPPYTFRFIAQKVHEIFIVNMFLNLNLTPCLNVKLSTCKSWPIGLIFHKPNTNSVWLFHLKFSFWMAFKLAKTETRVNSVNLVIRPLLIVWFFSDVK